MSGHTVGQVGGRASKTVTVNKNVITVTWAMNMTESSTYIQLSWAIQGFQSGVKIKPAAEHFH